MLKCCEECSMMKIRKAEAQVLVRNKKREVVIADLEECWLPFYQNKQKHECVLIGMLLDNIKQYYKLNVVTVVKGREVRGVVEFNKK